jgi:hypothetical protein
MTVSGNNMGCELVFDVEDDTIVLVGNGTYKNGSVNGNFTLRADDYDIVEVLISDFDLKQFHKGYLNGTFEFSVGDGLSEFYPGIDISDDYMLSLVSSMSEGNLDWQLGLDCGDDSLGTLKITSKTGKASSIKLPDSKNTVTVSNDYEIMDWLETVSLSPFIKNLKSAGVPQDWLDELEDISDSIESGDVFNLMQY